MAAIFFYTVFNLLCCLSSFSSPFPDIGQVSARPSSVFENGVTIAVYFSLCVLPIALLSISAVLIRKNPRWAVLLLFLPLLGWLVAFILGFATYGFDIDG